MARLARNGTVRGAWGAPVLLVAAMGGWLAASAGAADQDAQDAPRRGRQVDWKFTPTYQSSTREPPAWDFNLRGNTDTQTWWVGYYQRQQEVRQARLGYERPLEWEGVRVVPTIQYATGGFLGASVYGELGATHYAILGWSRTNLEESFSIAFDPNESITFGAGTRVLPNTVLSLFQIRDDRLDTGQRVTHLVGRIRPDGRTRWTVDVFTKTGRPDSDPASPRLHGTGAAMTYDFDRYFIRVASDPYVNFTDSHMLRVAVGLRF